MWLPLVLAGSVLYWTVALGLGSLSVSFLGDSGSLLGDDGDERLELEPSAPNPAGTAPRDEPIVVHLQTYSEARALAPALLDEPPAVPVVDDGTGTLPGHADAPAVAGAPGTDTN
jgi:hypothetical protein